MESSACNQTYNLQSQCLIAILASCNSHNYYSCFRVSVSTKQIHCVTIYKSYIALKLYNAEENIYKKAS